MPLRLTIHKPSTADRCPSRLLQWRGLALRLQALGSQAAAAAAPGLVGAAAGLAKWFGTRPPSKAAAAAAGSHGDPLGPFSRFTPPDLAPPPPPSRSFNRKLLAEKTMHLRRVRLAGNVREMMFSLRLDLTRDMANLEKW